MTNVPSLRFQIVSQIVSRPCTGLISIKTTFSKFVCPSEIRAITGSPNNSFVCAGNVINPYTTPFNETGNRSSIATTSASHSSDGTRLKAFGNPLVACSLISGGMVFYFVVVLAGWLV
jgi:hypothetical protein